MQTQQHTADASFWRRLPILLLIWWLLNFLIPFDRKFMSSILNLATLAILLGVWMQIRDWPGALGRKALLRFIAVFALLFLIGFLRVVLADRISNSTGFSEILRAVFSKPRHSRELIQAPLLATFSVLLYLGMREKARAEGAWTPALRRVAAPFPLLCLVFYASAAFGSDPLQSLYLFAREGGLYLPLGQLLLIESRRMKSIRPWLLPLCAAGLVFAFGSGVVFLLGTAGSDSLRVWMEGREWIRWEAGPSAVHLWRVQFPFEHHNRMASYFLLALFAIPALFAQRRQGRFAMLQILALLPVFAILISKTRGAYIAGAIGLLATFLAAGNWRKTWFWASILGGCMALLLIPGVRQRAGSIFLAETYTQPGSTLYLRYAGWRAGCSMIADRPFLGVGYGSKTFAKVYRKQYQQRFRDPEAKPHAHNNFLEVAAESGLGALALFLWLNGLIAWRLWKKRKTGGDCYRPALLGLLAAIHAYGMANYNLRQGVGFLLWGLLALLASESVTEKEETRP